MPEHTRPVWISPRANTCMFIYKTTPTDKMPTLLLLDRSLSMKRPASTEHPLPRLSLAKEGINTLLSYLEAVFPSEHVGLINFSSSPQLVCPFTRDLSEVREALDSVSVEDRTDLPGAVQFLTELIPKEWGVFIPVQVILISDGLLGGGASISTDSPYCFPFPCQFNVLFIATEDEFNQIDGTILESFARSIDISPSSIIVSKGSKLTAETVTDSFLSLAKMVFFPYDGILKCGHLECHFTLSPSPRMVHTASPISTDVRHRFSNPYNVIEFPSEIRICGFVDLGVVSAPAVYSKHFLVDNEFSKQDKLEQFMKKLMVKKGKEKEEEKEEEEEENMSAKPSFRVLLHGSLKCEAKVAIVQLSENWFALLSSASASSKKSNLILTILFPGDNIPWFGQMSYLGSKVHSGSDPRLSESTSSKSAFPVSIPHFMSYQAPSSLFWAKEPGLQTDFAKLVRYSHKLPEKEASLIKELNKLRQVVLTYSLPNLSNAMCNVLAHEETNTTNHQAKAILQYCIQFLSTNQNPHDKLSPMTK